LSPGCVLGDAGPQFRGASDCDSVLPDGFREPTILRGLHVPRDLPAEMLAISDWVLRPEQLLVNRLELLRLHLRQIHELR
jgi:hypothetical protein